MQQQQTALITSTHWQLSVVSSQEYSAARHLQQVRAERFVNGVRPLLTSRRLSETEGRILAAEIMSPSLKWLREDDCWDVLVDLWSAVKMMTGALLYPVGAMLDNQMLMLNQFIISHPRFSTLTEQEIRYAFQLNYAGSYGEIHKHYNRELNAEFVGSVLTDYVRLKQDILRHKGDLIRNLLDPPTEVKPVLPTPEEWCQMIQGDYELFRLGETDRIYNATPKYYFLRRANLLCYTSRKKYWDWYHRALVLRERKVRTKPSQKIGDRIAKEHALEMYEAIRTEGVIPRQEHINVFHLMRRLVYLQFFDLLAHTGINRIFEDIEFTLPNR